MASLQPVGGVFGQPATQPTQPVGGLFGLPAAQPIQPSGRLFGQQPAAQPVQPVQPVGELFGQQANQPVVQSPGPFAIQPTRPFGQPQIERDVEEPTEHVDPSGDLTLLVKVGNKRKSFIVSSKVMCLASPIWRAMLDPKGHFKEASPDNKEITFEDDDLEALQLLLDISHMRYLKIPTSLKYNGLLNLTILCDKYDTVTLVRPWLPKWLPGLKHLADHPGYEEWLFIAWVLGDAETFERIASRLVSTIEIRDGLFGSESRIYIDGRTLSTQHMPPGIVGQ